MDGKWQKQQDQRAIQSRDVNNGSYLVTWVTSCSSRQPLPNLWTSFLVRAEPQQSPCVTLCTCCEHRASFADIFASRKVPGHWPCLPQAGAAVRQHRSPPQVAICTQPEMRDLALVWWVFVACLLREPARNASRRDEYFR